LDYFIRFAQPILLYISLFLLVGATCARLLWHRTVTYLFPLVSFAQAQGAATQHPYKKIFFMTRFVALLLLAILSGKPQLVDRHSNIIVEGIDIVLVLDISGSMQLQDYKDDPRSRVDVAKVEAIRFINNRDNDAIGLIIFGNDALSRCPLTLDKNVLKDIVNELRIGIVDPNGTVLSRGIITAANRLKKSQAKSKIMIVLTDGAPSENDSKPSIAIEVVKQLGIKMYTIGIGSEKEYSMHPYFGQVLNQKINKQLLKVFAQETGGQFFMAQDAHDMRKIYDTINQLETTEYETPIYSKYYDIFMPFLWAVLALILFEILFSTFVWFSL